MVPTIARQTRIARTSCTPLTNFWITNLKNFKTGIIRNDITDHLPIFLIYEPFFDTVKLSPTEIYSNVINELTLESFYRNFSLSNKHDVLRESDVSCGAVMYHEKLIFCYKESISLKNKVIYVKNHL